MDSNEPSAVYPRTINHIAVSVSNLEEAIKMVSGYTRVYINKAANRICSR
jgi:hypothetical protein